MDNPKCIEDGHIGKVVKFRHELIDGDVKEFVALWGCTRCDATSEEQWAGFGVIKSNPDHKEDDEDCLCFGCKAKGLQLATGDAAGNIIASGTTQKKWDKELDFYKQARAQGVQPEGTSRQSVEKALEASEVLNKPYNGGEMPKAQHITKEVVSVMKELGKV